MYKLIENLKIGKAFRLKGDIIDESIIEDGHLPYLERILETQNPEPEIVPPSVPAVPDSLEDEDGVSEEEKPKAKKPKKAKE